MSASALPLAVSMGDPAGIGLDITLMGWVARQQHRLPPFAVFGCPRALHDRAVQLGLSVPIREIASAGDGATEFASALPVVAVPAGTVVSGKPSTATASATIAAIEQAVAAVSGGQACAVVTNPIAKSVLYQSGFTHPGHTEFLAHLANERAPSQRIRPVMMLACEDLRVVPLTVHIPLTAVAPAVTRELIVETARITRDALQRDFGLSRARIAVCGLNPHAGEDGSIGREEIDVIRPALDELRAEGLSVSGPHSADTMFHAAARKTYDAAIAMYHDQALIPIKTLAFDRGVNVTLGLPFVRTSPDHGTAFAIAGTGAASPDSFIAACRMGGEMSARRNAVSAP